MGEVKRGSPHQRTGTSNGFNALGHCDEDIRLLAGDLRARPDNVRVEERRGKGITGQNNVIGR